MDDSATIASQRCKMFQDNGLTCSASFEVLERQSIEWLRVHLRDGSYVGWLVEDDARMVAGAGVWLMEWPPHYLDVRSVRGYLTNIYVDPAARGQGLGTELLELAIAECRNRGVRVAVLHASSMGRPVYEKKGWKSGEKMILRLDEASPV